jgi:hypothetical protein
MAKVLLWKELCLENFFGENLYTKTYLIFEITIKFSLNAHVI